MKAPVSELPPNVKLAPQDYPPGEEVIVITSFDEATEIHRSPKMKGGSGTRAIRVGVDSAGKITGTAPFEEAQEHPEMVSWETLLRRGALSQLDGAAHTQARKLLNPLFGRDAHLWFRDKVILPELARNLSSILNDPDADGVVRADLVALGRRVFAHAASALVGFDEAHTPEGIEALMKLNARIEGGRHLVQFNPGHPQLREHMQRVLDSRTELFERFYRPSLETRKRSPARRGAGAAGDGDERHDLLTLIANGTLPVDDQAGLALAMQFINGATDTNTQVVTRTVGHLADWFARHPEDHALRTDPTFLHNALQDVIRLHGPGPTSFSRMALEDVTLSSGRTIKAGQYVAMIKDAINQDTSVFGPDADQFNPRRVVPTGVYPFGLGFGSGSHMCIGLPLVLGQGGLTGFEVPLIQELYAAGIRPDPARPPEKRMESFPYMDQYATFPVLFDRRD